MQVDDIILKLRRTVRNKRPVAVTVLSLNHCDYVMTSAARFHYFRNSIGEIAEQRGAELIGLPGGEVVLIRDGADDVVSFDVQILLEDQEDAWTGDQRPDQFIETFILPDNYVALRERLEKCGSQQMQPPAERSRETVVEPASDSRLKGPLTPGMLAEMEDFLDSMDLTPFVQRQAIYRRGARWQPVYVEHFTSIPDLTARLFSDVSIDQDAPLFSEFRRHLDRLMLINILMKRPFRNQTIGVNIEWTTRKTAEFHRLEKQLSSPERRRLVVELHWADYLRDLAAGGTVVSELKALGFAVAIDRIGIDMLPIVNFSHCPADYIKILFEKDKLPLLRMKACQDAFDLLDAEKIVLSGCDDPLALRLGERAGITMYQGWSISRMAREERTAAA